MLPKKLLHEHFVRNPNLGDEVPRPAPARNAGQQAGALAAQRLAELEVVRGRPHQAAAEALHAAAAAVERRLPPGDEVRLLAAFVGNLLGSK